jgi:excisionase family DNA binding protein
MHLQSAKGERKPNAAELLNEILRRPESIPEIPFEAIPATLAQLAAVQSMLAARLIETQEGDKGAEHTAGDRLLTVEEAAERLGVARDFLYRRTARLPFTVRLGRAVRFSESGLTRWIRSRNGR